MAPQLFHNHNFSENDPKFTGKWYRPSAKLADDFASTLHRMACNVRQTLQMFT